MKKSAFNPAPLASDPIHQRTWDAAVVCLKLAPHSSVWGRSWIQNGWPDKLTPGLLAHLQWPDNADERQALAFGLLRDCMRDAIPAHHDERLVVIQNELWMRHPIFQSEVRRVSEEDRHNAYRVECVHFQRWLAQQKAQPSRHISAWFAANDLQPVGKTASASCAADGEAWKLTARERANEIIKRQREVDLYPSQENIAAEIAREFRKGGIVGAGGKPLTGAYIKRHALKGISSAKGKQLSTSIRRGK